MCFGFRTVSMSSLALVVTSLGWLIPMGTRLQVLLSPTRDAQAAKGSAHQSTVLDSLFSSSSLLSPLFHLTSLPTSRLLGRSTSLTTQPIPRPRLSSNSRNG